jgi:glutamyl-tRNA(Gln) amidotransferase subunit E
MDMRVVDEVHFMRKTVVDGSNTSGFQRTALVAHGGSITVDGKQVGIEQLCLEEDSGKVVSRTAETDTYNLSRLGIPLLEITTKPDLHSPEEVKAAAAHIGMILRSTERVKRGLGTIRQDVNVSVPGGERVEIKGAQDLDTLGLLVENEARRQRALISLARVIPKQTYSVLSVTEAFKATNAAFIAKAVQQGSDVLGIRLGGWKQALDAELQPGVRLGKELAGYAKANGFGGLIHSAEAMSKYSFTTESDALHETLGCESGDAWLVMVGEKEKLLAFFDTVLIPRLEALSVGVPSEVRKAEADGTNSYLRPMPGASRMYPETDVRPFTPRPQDVPLPELITHKAVRLAKEYDIHEDLASQIAREGLGTIYEGWVRSYPALQASTLASILTAKAAEIKTRHDIDIDIVTLAPHVLPALNDGTITLAALEDVLVTLGKGEALDLSKYAAVPDEEVAMVIAQLVNENPGASVGLLMGKVMKHFAGRADGKKVQELLRKAGAGANQ